MSRSPYYVNVSGNTGGIQQTVTGGTHNGAMIGTMTGNYYGGQQNTNTGSGQFNTGNYGGSYQNSTGGAIHIHRGQQSQAYSELATGDTSPTPAAMAGQKIHVLVCDGGGIRGYIMLKVLKGIFQRVGIPMTTRPCEVFDVICGTSTGGLVAILLGRLGLTIDEAIAAYKELGSKIFEGKGIISKISSGSKYGSGNARQAFESIVEKYSKKKDPKMMNDVKGACKTFVTTVRHHDQQQPLATFAYLIRSYAAPSAATRNLDNPEAWSIVDAALATSAAPFYFDPFAKAGLKFRDAGAAGFNNPAGQALIECKLLFGRDFSKDLGIFLSLGTGLAAFKPEHSDDTSENSGYIRGLIRKVIRGKDIPSERIGDFKKFFSEMVSLATDTEKVEEDMGVRPEMGERGEHYVRAQISEGLGDFHLDDVNQISTFDAIYDQWIGGSVARTVFRDTKSLKEYSQKPLAVQE